MRNDLHRRYPFGSLAVVPFTVLLLLCLWIHQYTESMLFPIPPAAYVCLSVRPVKSALTVFLASFEVAFIASTVCPRLQTATFHFAKAEFTLVEFVQVGKIVLAKALKRPIDEVSLVIRAVLPLKSSTPLLLSLEKLSNISGIGLARASPCFYAITML